MTASIRTAKSTPSVVVVGGGFAGFYAARTLERLLPAEAADLTLISATDHLLYSPLLPEVAAGRLDPRRIAVPLHARLNRTRIIQAMVEAIDFDQRTLVLSADHCPVNPVRWDRLALTTGSVTRVLPTPGLEAHGLGLKTLVEAQYLHDHVLRQMEMADATDDLDERRARLTFVVVGAWTSPRGSCPNSAPGSLAPPCGSSAAAAWTSCWARRFQRSPRTASSSPTARDWRRGPSCGPSA
jgi:NADH dehydrogenase